MTSACRAVTSRSTCSAVVPSPMLARTAVPSVPSVPPHSRSSSGWAQNRPSRTPMPCSADRYAATRPAGWPATVKLCTATRSVLSGQISQQGHARHRRQTGREPVEQDALVGRPRPVQHRRERPAGLGERGDAEDVRGARLVPVRRGCPASPRRGRPGSRRPRRRGRASRRRASRGARPAPPRRRARRACARTARRSPRRSRRGRPGGAGRAARRRRPPGRPRACAIATIRSSGSTSPVTLDAPVTVSSAVGCAAQRGLEVGQGLRDGRGRRQRAVRPCSARAAGWRGARRPGTTPARGRPWPAGSARPWCCG